MKENEMTIDIAKQFSAYPSGRVPKDGDNNGERFRNEILIPALNDVIDGKGGAAILVVDIDGCRTFGSSFLEEAFGGLARVPAFRYMEAMDKLKIKCSKPHLRIYHDAIIEYLNDAKAGYSAPG